MRRLMPNFHSPNNQWMHNNPPRRRCRHALRSLRRRYKYSILYIIYVYDAIPPAALHPTVCTQYDQKFANYWWLMYSLCYFQKPFIGSVTSLWPGLSVARSVWHNFLKCSYRSSCWMISLVWSCHLSFGIKFYTCCLDIISLRYFKWKSGF